jgi:hypothetical protein
MEAGVVFPAEEGLPIYDETYSEALSLSEDPPEPENLLMIGRNGFCKYNNQDYSMLTAILAVQNIYGAGPISGVSKATRPIRKNQSKKMIWDNVRAGFGQLHHSGSRRSRSKFLVFWATVRMAHVLAPICSGTCLAGAFTAYFSLLVSHDWAHTARRKRFGSPTCPGICQQLTALRFCASFVAGSYWSSLSGSLADRQSSRPHAPVRLDVLSSAFSLNWSFRHWSR